MMKKIKQLVVLVTFLMITSAANAQCDYRPSQWLGEGETGVMTALVAGAGPALKKAGLYKFTHTSGTIMLASKAAGASAAKTVGIIKGTAGLVGAVGSGLISSGAIITAVALAGVVVMFEGACYLIDK
jgi:hypothetical protein